MMDLSFLSSMGFAVPNSTGVYEIPFIDRMGFVFLFCVIGMYILTVTELKGRDNPKGLEVDSSMFRTSPGFTIGTIAILAIITALYTMFW